MSIWRVLPDKAIAQGSGEKAEDEVVVPSGAFDLAAEPCARLTRSTLRAKRHRRARCPGAFARPSEILVQDHVEHPVQAVLDLPVRAHEGEEVGGGERPREQVVAGRGGGPAVLLARRGDLANRAEAGEGMGCGEPGDVVDDRGAARLDPALVLSVVAARSSGGASGSSSSSRTSSWSAGWLALSASTYSPP
jgi:hypothetical protein